MLKKLHIKTQWLGRQDYLCAYKAMQAFTRSRTETTSDEIWLLEHNPVFTQGQNGKAEHVLNPGQIPVIETDRGGQVTYHGPGQLMMYTLLDLKKYRLHVRQIVTLLEESVSALLSSHGIQSYSQCKAPGVYVDEKKICSIGLRISRGCAYHGLAFNVCMDLEPFDRINPCGFDKLKMTQFSEHGGLSDVKDTGFKLAESLILKLSQSL